MKYAVQDFKVLSQEASAIGSSIKNQTVNGWNKSKGKTPKIRNTPANDNSPLGKLKVINTQPQPSLTSNIKSVEERVQKIHKNSHEHVGDTHVYRIIDQEGKTYKIGQSSQGLTKYGESKRAIQQKRKLGREKGEFYDTEIIKILDNKKKAYNHENKLIKSFRKLYGKDSLLDNKGNH